MYRSGEVRLVQEVAKAVVLVQERRGEACTRGGKDRCPSTGEERRGLYRSWCELCTGGGKESPVPVLYRERNWIG